MLHFEYTSVFDRSSSCNLFFSRQSRGLSYLHSELGVSKLDDVQVIEQDCVIYREGSSSPGLVKRQFEGNLIAFASTKL